MEWLDSAGGRATRHFEQVSITTKLRRAVKHASLSAHQQGLDLAGCHRRKDFPNPARDQETLLCSGNAPIIPRWHAIAPAASGDTNPPILRSQCLRVATCLTMTAGAKSITHSPF